MRRCAAGTPGSGGGPKCSIKGDVQWTYDVDVKVESNLRGLAGSQAHAAGLRVGLQGSLAQRPEGFRLGEVLALPATKDMAVTYVYNAYIDI